MPRLPRPRLPRLRVGERAEAFASRLDAAVLDRWPLGSPGPRLRAFGARLDDGARAIGRAARSAWLGLSLRRRWAIGVVAAVAVVVVLFAVAAVPALPCAAPGGDVCPPADDAIHLAPSDALAYVHVNADPDTEQFHQADEIAGRVPTLAQQLVDRLLSQVPGPHGRPPDFAFDITPWFGGEAAEALVPAGASAAEVVVLLEVASPSGAQRYASSIATGRVQRTTYRNVPVQVDRRGLATAEVDGFLAIGTQGAVRDAIDARSAAQGTGSLADDPSAEAARDALPDERVADAYLSRRGIGRLVANPRGRFSTFAAVIAPGSSRGAAAALVASSDGLEVAVRSELDPARARAHPGFFAAFPAFAPTLAGSLPQDALAYLGFAVPGRTILSLLGQARAVEPALAASVRRLVEKVQKQGHVDLEHALLPALGDQAALALEPAGGGPGGASPPYLLFLASDVDSAQLGPALANLEAPLARTLNSKPSGHAPVFGERKVGGVTARSLRLSPTIELTYAFVGSSLVVATDPAGVEQVASGKGGLSTTDSYGRATGGLPSKPSLTAYLNLGGLLALAEGAGLSESPAYATFATELRKLEAAGLGVAESSTELATDLHLVVAGS